MGTLSTILRKADDGRVMFWCPGCGRAHGIHVDHGKTPRWDYNGDPEKPTFSPSVLATWPGMTKRCHSFVRDGQIEFLSDCSHELAGKTVPLPPWDDEPSARARRRKA